MKQKGFNMDKMFYEKLFRSGIVVLLIMTCDLGHASSDCASLFSFPKNSILRGLSDIESKIGDLAEAPQIIENSASVSVVIEALFFKAKDPDSQEVLDFKIKLSEQVGKEENKEDIYGARHLPVKLTIETQFPANGVLGKKIINESKSIEFNRGPVFVGSGADAKAVRAIEAAAISLGLVFDKGQGVLFRNSVDIQVEGLNRLLGLEDKSQTSDVDITLATMGSRIGENKIEIKRHLTIRFNPALSTEVLSQFWNIFIQNLYS